MKIDGIKFELTKVTTIKLKATDLLVISYKGDVPYEILERLYNCVTEKLGHERVILAEDGFEFMVVEDVGV